MPADVGATPAVGHVPGLPGDVTPGRTSFGDCAGHDSSEQLVGRENSELLNIKAIIYI